MKKVFLWTGGIVLVLLISFILMLVLYKPVEDEPNYAKRPLPSHTLKTESGDSVQIEEKFPNQDYLLLFFVETSPTSLTQLAELTKIIESVPQNVSIILIHLGRMHLDLPDWAHKRLHLLIDPEANLARTMGIRTVPTLLLLNNQDFELAFAEKLVPAEELMTYITLLEQARNNPAIP